MKFYKLLFLILLIMGTLVSISSYSWMGMWMGLEINLISVIPLFASKNSYSAEASIKYFIVQAFASTIILFSIIMFSLNNSFLPINLNDILILMLNSSLLTKMGAAPFHFWFPEVLEGLNWLNSLILLTWQKIAPMILLMNNMKISLFLFIIIISSMFVSGIQGLNQISLRKIMAYSSINHMGWMIAASTISYHIWLIYFMIYMIITFNIIMIFYILNIFFIKQMIMMSINNPLLKMILFFNFFSLGGLPPFLGFFPKWLLINELIMEKMYILSLMMIILTLFTLYYYIRLMLSSMMMNYQMKIFYIHINTYWILMINMISIMSLALMIMMTSFI